MIFGFAFGMPDFVHFCGVGFRRRGGGGSPWGDDDDDFDAFVVVAHPLV